MKQRILSFQQVVARLESANIPCNIKRVGYDNEVQYFVEFGTNYPEHLIDDVNIAFANYGEVVPNYIHLCGHSFSEDMTAQKKISGGPRIYYGYNKW